MSSPSQKSAAEAQPLIAVRKRSREQPLVCRIARSGRPSRSSAPRRVRSHLALRPIAASTARLGRGGPSQSRQRRRGASGTRRRAVVPGRRFRRGGRARSPVGRGHYRRRCTSILRPDTGRFGCAIRTDMWWRSPVRTVKAIPKTKPRSVLGALPFHETPFVIANERGSRAALARDDDGGDMAAQYRSKRKFLLSDGFPAITCAVELDKSAVRAFHNAALRAGAIWLV